MDSVHKVMADGKVCLLDVHPSVSERKSAEVAVNEFGGTLTFWFVLPAATSRGWKGQESLQRANTAEKYRDCWR